MFFSRQFFSTEQVPKGTKLPGSGPQRHSAGILSASSEAKAVHCIVYEWNHKSWNVRREGTVCFHSHTTHREQPPEVPILQATPRCDLYSGAPSSSCAPERSLGSYKGLSTSPGQPSPLPPRACLFQRRPSGFPFKPFLHTLVCAIIFSSQLS